MTSIGEHDVAHQHDEWQVTPTVVGATREPAPRGASTAGMSSAIPSRLCVRGCGRAPAAGLDRHGKPFVTCCRGCAFGQSHDAACHAPGTAATAVEDPDYVLAMTLQLQEQHRAHEARARGRGRWQAARRKASELVYSTYDPVWGEVELKGFHADDGTYVRRKRFFAALAFTTCPCLMVTFRCFKGEVKSGLSSADVRRAWGRVLFSWSTLLAALQVAAFICVVEFYGGYVPFSQNSMIGPHPHALDPVGAKNAARIMRNHEWWRLLTPIMLHAGWLHLAGNVFVQLRAGLTLEVLWGHSAWLLIYVLSGAYGNLVSCVFMPDHLGVGSSGALCGIIGAWPPFLLITWNQTSPTDLKVRNLQLAAVLISIVVLIVTSFLPMVDFAAHFGGLVVGAALSAVIFAGRLQSLPWRVATRTVGILFIALLVPLTLGWFLIVVFEIIKIKFGSKFSRK